VKLAANIYWRRHQVISHSLTKIMYSSWTPWRLGAKTDNNFKILGPSGRLTLHFCRICWCRQQIVSHSLTKIMYSLFLPNNWNKLKLNSVSMGSYLYKRHGCSLYSTKNGCRKVTPKSVALKVTFLQWTTDTNTNCV